MHDRRWPRRIQRLAVALLATLALGVALAPGAYAHPILLRSDPPDGSTLPTSPRQLKLWFSESVARDLVTLELRDGAGTVVARAGHGDAGARGPLGRLIPGATARTSLRGDQGRTVVMPLPTLTRGVYELRWSAVSAEDLHALSGTLVFGVQRTPHRLAPVTEVPPDPLDVGLRWADLGATAIAIGALAMGLVVLPGAARRLRGRMVPGTQAAAAAIQRRCLSLCIAGGVAALAASAALLARQSAAGAGAGTSLGLGRVLAETPVGQRWCWRAVALVAFVLGVALARRASTGVSWRMRGTLTLLAVASIVPLAWSSHVTVSSGGRAISVISSALHLLAASIWAGGVLVLVATVLGLRRHGDNGSALGREMLRGFAIPAVVSLAVLVVTGLVLAGRQVASPDALLRTRYGWTLVVKVVLVTGAGALGLYHFARLRARRSGRVGPPHPSLLAEALVVVSVLGLGAALTLTQPARGPRFQPPPASSTPTATRWQRVDDLMVSVAIQPAQPGPNYVTVGVYDTRRPAPAPVRQVVVGLRARGSALETVPVSPAGDQRWQAAGVSLDRAGDWVIAVTIARPGLPDAHVRTRWTVSPASVPAPRERVLVSSRPLAPVLDRLAAVLGALLVASGLVVVIARVRRRRVSETAAAPTEPGTRASEDQARREARKLVPAGSGMRRAVDADVT